MPSANGGLGRAREQRSFHLDVHGSELLPVLEELHLHTTLHHNAILLLGPVLGPPELCLSTVGVRQQLAGCC